MWGDVSDQRNYLFAEIDKDTSYPEPTPEQPEAVVWEAAG